MLEIKGKEICCKQMSMISVLPRQLGPLSRWADVLRPLSDLGYNAVHFMPIQEYGVSRSHYSLADQTSIDDYFFEE
jgi:glycogen debranching enzyme